MTQPVNPPGTSRSLMRTQTVAEMLDASGNWRPESENFGKLHRLYGPAIAAFERGVHEPIPAGKPLGQWRDFFATNPARVAKKAAAAAKKVAKKRL